MKRLGLPVYVGGRLMEKEIPRLPLAGPGEFFARKPKTPIGPALSRQPVPTEASRAIGTWYALRALRAGIPRWSRCTSIPRRTLSPGCAGCSSVARRTLRARCASRAGRTSCAGIAGRSGLPSGPGCAGRARDSRKALYPLLSLWPSPASQPANVGHLKPERRRQAERLHLLVNVRRRPVQVEIAYLAVSGYRDRAAAGPE